MQLLTLRQKARLKLSATALAIAAIGAGSVGLTASYLFGWPFLLTFGIAWAFLSACILWELGKVAISEAGELQKSDAGLNAEITDVEQPETKMSFGETLLVGCFLGCIFAGSFLLVIFRRLGMNGVERVFLNISDASIVGALFASGIGFCLLARKLKWL